MQARAATLAAAARRLQDAGGTRAPFALVFLTDGQRGPDAMDVAQALPQGAALIYRDYDEPRRAAKARALAGVCEAGGVLFLVGGDAALAREAGAAGVHLRSDQLTAQPDAAGLLVTASCHGADDLARAAAIGADAAFLSPVFATQSHPDAAPLGPEEFLRLARTAALPVFALGGVDDMNAFRLAGRNVAGFGAIGAFAAGVARASER